MLGAQAAIERTTSPRLDGHPLWHLSRRGKLAAVEPFGIAADKVLAHSMRCAVLAKVHAPTPFNNLRRD
jgi:hypothetical protein